jgi:hypothetical protein
MWSHQVTGSTEKHQKCQGNPRGRLLPEQKPEAQPLVPELRALNEPESFLYPFLRFQGKTCERGSPRLP